MSYGTSVYATTEPVGSAPVDYGTKRECEKCSGYCNRYTTPTEGYLLCNRCVSAAARMGSVAKFVGGPKRGRGAYERTIEHTQRLGKHQKRGVYLPGLKGALEAKGWTGAKLGRKSGVSQSRILELRLQYGRASEATVEKLAEALGVSIEELTGERLEGAF